MVLDLHLSKDLGKFIHYFFKVAFCPFSLSSLSGTPTLTYLYAWWCSIIAYDFLVLFFSYNWILSNVVSWSSLIFLLHDWVWCWDWVFQLCPCVWGQFIREHTQTFMKLKRKSILLTGGCMGNVPKSCSPYPHSSLYFMHKTHPGLHTLVSKNS